MELEFAGERAVPQLPEATSDAAVTFPVVSRSSTRPDGILPNAVANAFDMALDDAEEHGPAFLDLEGMSGRR